MTADARRRVRGVVLLATRNANKAREIRAIYAHLHLDIITLNDRPEVGELPERGITYAENAASKAAAAAAATGLVAIADDSGIEIDALAGAPGPHSRRFLGDEATDDERNRHILALLADVPDDRRTARYRAAVAVASPGRAPRVFEGLCEGKVARAPRGRRGFGYDPMFVATQDGRTMAELSFEEKNRISHRARALRAAEPYLLWVIAAAAGEERHAPGANTRTGAPGTPAFSQPDTDGWDESSSGGRR
ncbi:MAG TPA: RdgB/HAM1 family non-canonical purine NTP pyrophosphatase [bacterium]|nr:RdgB/HAM1 family non-canonical purine NTP pyrophosphatase [bacterium]